VVVALLLIFAGVGVAMMGRPEHAAILNSPATSRNLDNWIRAAPTQ